jgi:large subunit ribosomal protein L7/L12
LIAGCIRIQFRSISNGNRKEDILEAVDAMTVMELNDLVKAFEEKFGVSAAAWQSLAGWRRCRCCGEKTEFTSS